MSRYQLTGFIALNTVSALQPPSATTQTPAAATPKPVKPFLRKP